MLVSLFSIPASPVDVVGDDILDHDLHCDYYDADSLRSRGFDLANNIFMLTSNIRSFNANYDEFSAVVRSAGVWVDVLVLCETWFTAGNVIDIPGYTCVHCCRVNRVGGGVSIYVVNDLKCLVKEVCNHSDNIVEIPGVKLTSECNGTI